jgi:hypothetical protein
MMQALRDQQVCCSSKHVRREVSASKALSQASVTLALKMYIEHQTVTVAFSVQKKNDVSCMKLLFYYIEDEPPKAQYLEPCSVL